MTIIKELQGIVKIINKIIYTNIFIYTIYIISQIIIWGGIIYLAYDYELTIFESIYYLFTADILTIGLISFAILPNILFIMSLFENEKETDNIQ